MMNTKLRKEELVTMKVTELKEIAKSYKLKVSGKKADIIEEILNYESNLNVKDQKEGPKDDDAYWNYLMRQAAPKKKKSNRYEEHWQYLLDCCVRKEVK